jgi:hypothetical protein
MAMLNNQRVYIDPPPGSNYKEYGLWRPLKEASVLEKG